jgi:hypothetical protein
MSAERFPRPRVEDEKITVPRELFFPMGLFAISLEFSLKGHKFFKFTLQFCVSPVLLARGSAAGIKGEVRIQSSPS